MAPQAARWVPTALDGAWGLLRCTRCERPPLQPAVGVNIASCNGRVKVSCSLKCKDQIVHVLRGG